MTTQFKLFVTLCVMTLLVTSCKTDNGKNMVRGYEYTVDYTENGAELQPGDFVSFTLKIVDNNGKVYQENMTEPLPAIQVPSPDEPAAQPNPIIDMIAQSRVGDSLTLMMPKDSLKGQLPPESESIEHLAYVLKIVRSQDEETYQAEQEKIKQESMAQAEIIKARELEVKEFVDQVNADIKSGKANIQTLENGLKYIIHEEGEGENAKEGDSVDVLYYGTTAADGNMFDNAFSRGTPFNFTLGRGMVIQGWDLGIPLLKEGGKATLIIPAELGYGDQGAGANIPGGATLHFYVELLEIK